MGNKDVYELTNPQKNIWLTEQYNKGTSINNICAYLKINDILNLEILEKALNFIIKNNSIFLTKFKLVDGNLQQYISDYEYVHFKCEKCDSFNEVKKLTESLYSKVFEIENNYLFKFVMFQLPDNTGGLILNIHHLLGDSWTLGLISKQIINVYNMLLQNTEPKINSSNYFDFYNTEKKYLSSEKFQKDKEYWENQFDTIPEIASIPSQNKNINDKLSCAANRNSYPISMELTKKIADYCKKNKLSTFNFLIAVYSIYISRVTNMKDFVIGSPILNRSSFAEKNMMGMFVNTVPMRINLDNKNSFLDFVSNISQNSFTMFRHQKYPYEYILKNLRKDNKNLPNLYNILISYQITKAITDSQNYSVEWVFNKNSANELEITIEDLNDIGSLNIAYDYQLQKYTSKEIDEIHMRILNIIEQILNIDSILLNDIEILTMKEKQELINIKNIENYSDSNSIIELIENTAKRFPNKIAIEDKTFSLTYSELMEKVNKTSNYLLTTFNFEEKTNIGIFAHRKIETIILILSILKINCTIVPIDPEYPTERIDYMIKVSNIKFILSSEKVERDLSIDIINIKQTLIDKCDSEINKKFNYDKNNNLYIIFTSGSTGKPKGVCLKHENMINLISYELFTSNMFDKIDTLRILQFATMSFDVSYQEIFTALVSGGCLILISDYARKNINKLINYISEKNINTLFFPPAYLKLLVENTENIDSIKKHLKIIITAGEALTITDGIKTLLKNNIQIYNHYGPAETHVATTFLVDKHPTYINVPIGYPIANCKVYILDYANKLCPKNVVGQIAISGACVGNGYYNNPDLTNKKFVKDDYFNPYNMYLTGDLGYIDNNSRINYIGRSDFQVKINGFRIEPGEISNILLQHKDINTSATIIDEYNGKKHIICFYTTSNNSLTESELKKYLKTLLPNYMLPAKLIKLSSIPLNMNGKIDKKSLPKVDYSLDATNKLELPTTITEKELCDIWKNILNIKKLGINTNFFELGGDSLIAINLMAKIKDVFNVDLTISDVYSNPTISELASFIDNSSKIVSTKLERKQNLEYYPLSSAQKRIYYSTQMSSNPLLYNISGGLLINKILDENKIKYIFKLLIKKHSSFRTCFKLIDDKPYQFILDKVNLNIKIFNDDKGTNIYDLINQFPKPFDFEFAPLLRINVHFIDNSKTLLLIDSHHIIIDGTSLNILINEFCKLYNNETIADEQIHYKDFALWENDFNKTDKIIELKNKWLDTFKGVDIPVINLPYDFPINQQKTYNGSHLTEKIPDTLFEKLLIIAKNEKLSPYVLFLSAFYILLYKYTGQNTLIIGSPISNRFDSSLENIIGMFVNNIPLLSNIDPSLSFSEFMTKTSNTLLTALDNQPYPYDMLIKNLNIPKNMSLFDVMFTYQNEHSKLPKIENTNIDIIYADTKSSKYNLSLEIIPNTNTINLEYNTDLFKEETVQKILNSYFSILNNIIENPQCKVSDFNVLSKIQKDEILYDFNRTFLEYPKNETLSNLFEKQVEKTPDKIALIFENKELTFSELNARANQLANYLRNHNIGRNDIIGIMTERSLELIIGILASLKCGCCYIPIDPSFPDERIYYMLENSNCKLLLTTTKNANKINSNNKLIIDLENTSIYSGNKSNLENISLPDDNSYIIYTSGSTGKPKGVLLKHKSLTNLAYHLNNYLDYFKEPDLINMCSVTTSSFDIFIFETIITLQAGIKVIIANEDEQKIPSKLNLLIKNYNINAIQMTPSRMQFFLDNIADIDNLKDLRYVTLAGEPLSETLVKSLLDIGVKKVYNGYGPSETTVFSTFTDVTNMDVVTIGKPISNTQLYILDNDMTPCPIGVTGELYIAGDGVGNGYLNNIELTQNSYIENPFIPNTIMYKVGDLCKYTNNGEVLCLGRVDNQIKIRGLRIELGEIENKILNFPNIQKCVVIKQIYKNREFISAYYIADKRIRIPELRAYLSKSLPNYMIPNYFTPLNDFPYTPNGKIDKKALPLPNISKKAQDNFVAPKTDLEIQLVNIFEDILSTKPIGIYDNFFELGGDSILAMRLNIELLKLSNKITYSDIYDNPTVNSLINLMNDTSHFDEDLDIVDNKQYINILNKNIIMPEEIKISNYRNLLLTGATGFLGIHVLDSFLQNNSGKVYCIIRDEPGITARQKLLNKLHYYFKDKYDNLIDKRIFIVNGDLSKNNFNLSDSDYYNLGMNIDIALNCAAKVDHFGKYKTFYDINVEGVKNLIDFCKIYKKRLFHISTLSISGNSFVDDYATNQGFEKDVDFNENNFYIGQRINNVYIRTKFEAEKLMLDAMLDGLDGYILRLGNLMPRISDGVFQENISQNAYLNRIKAFLQLKCIPENMKDLYLELTPVDVCSNAIIHLTKYANKNNRIFHLFNHNHLYLNDILKILNESNYEIKIIQNNEFKNLIKNILEDDSKKYILDNLINDFGENLSLNYYSYIKIKSDFTIKYLEKLNFSWPIIDVEYIFNILKLIESR